MELAPYLYNEFGYSIDELIDNLRSLNYEFHDMKKFSHWYVNIHSKIKSNVISRK